MMIRERLWLKSLFLVGPLLSLAILTLVFILGQAFRVRADLNHLERQVSQTLRAELAGRSLIAEIKEYADSLVGDEDVRQEIVQVRRQTLEAFDGWLASIEGHEKGDAEYQVETLAMEYQQLCTSVDSALVRWDRGEIDAAQRLIRQGILRRTTPYLMFLVSDVLSAQEMALHGSFEGLHSGSQFGLLSWLGAEHLLERTGPRLQAMSRALEFSRLFYAELLGYVRTLLTPELVGQRRIEQSRSRADRSLERWRTFLDQQSGEAVSAKRQQFERLRKNVARVRASANEILDLAQAGFVTEAMEGLEEKVEELTRHQVLPAIDALAFEEQRAVANELDALSRLTKKVSVIAYGLSGLISLVCLGALFFLRRSILRPIGELRSAIERFRAGERDVRVVVRSSDELGVVSAEFNTMTKDLTQARLALEHRTREAEAARQQAEIASRIKTEFLNNMSHEFRTPINGLVGCIDILDSTDLDPDQRHVCEILRQSSNSMLTVVEDALAASQLLTGEIRIKSTPFALQEMLGDVVEIFQPKAREKGLTLTLRIEESLPASVIGDPGRIRQLLVHLIGNALKFTEEGGVTVAVAVAVAVDGECESRQAETVRLRIAVQDTGIGIPEDQREMIFGPFTQVDPSITRRYGGTGLGLSISRQLAELMGGSLKVLSRVGEGSTFELKLELACA